MGDFEGDRGIGRLGEERFFDMLRRHPLTERIEDVTGDPAWRARGADVLWRAEGRVLAIEVKTERRATGNLFLETRSRAEDDVPGWFAASRADVVAYGVLELDRWIVFDLEAMRAFVRHLPPLRHVLSKTSGRDGAVLYHTEGALLPLATPGLDRVVVTAVEGRFRAPGSHAPRGPIVLHAERPRWGLGEVVRRRRDGVRCVFEGLPEPVDLPPAEALRVLLRAQDRLPLGALPAASRSGSL